MVSLGVRISVMQGKYLNSWNKKIYAQMLLATML
uniref:Uncharacterized protein n=1 Tax=Arundo donax TaxID=35708 RepID=A0A0A9FH88_ARUDO